MSETVFETQSLEPETPITVSPQPRPLPGALLRGAREEKGISIAEVTQALKFSGRQIEALERDDYSNLRGATFLRGIVRSYARFLKLNEDEILALLEPEAVSVPEVNAPSSLDYEMPREVTGATSVVRKLLLLLVFVCIVAGAWYAWQWRQQHPRMEKTPDLASAITLAPAKPELKETITPVLPPQPQVQGEAAPAAAAPEATPSAAPAATEPPAATATPAVEAPAAPVPPQLVFQLNDKAWIEVKDASQKVVMRGEFPANSRQVATGRLPFQVVVGNAAHVRLQLNDKKIDLQPYILAEVARLTVDDKK